MLFLISTAEQNNYELKFATRTVSDYALLSSFSSLTKFTLCFWMKTYDSGDLCPFSLANTSGGDALHMMVEGNKISFHIGDESRYVLSK